MVIIMTYYPVSKSVKFDKYDKEVLLCPVCEGDYLHQDNTEVVHRIYFEDSDCMVHDIKNAREIETRILKQEKAHGRRDYVLISFVCEYCCEGTDRNIPWKLQIMQHKGRTLIEWVQNESSSS